MSQVADLDTFKEIPGYKAILKCIIKSQIQLLMEQLSDQTGEESIILTASVHEGTLSHLGSLKGKGFLEGRDEIKSQFLGYCLKNQPRSDIPEPRSTYQEHHVSDRYQQASTSHESLPITNIGQQYEDSGFLPDPGSVGAFDPSTSGNQPKVSRPSSGTPVPNKRRRSSSPAGSSSSARNAPRSYTETADNDSGSKDSDRVDTGQSGDSNQETSIKVEPVTDSEIELEITGVEMGGGASDYQGDWGPDTSSGMSYQQSEPGNSMLDQSGSQYIKVTSQTESFESRQQNEKRLSVNELLFTDDNTGKKRTGNEIQKPLKDIIFMDSNDNLSVCSGSSSDYDENDILLYHEIQEDEENSLGESTETKILPLKNKITVETDVEKFSTEKSLTLKDESGSLSPVLDIPYPNQSQFIENCLLTNSAHPIVQIERVDGYQSDLHKIESEENKPEKGFPEERDAQDLIQLNDQIQNKQTGEEHKRKLRPSTERIRKSLLNPSILDPKKSGSDDLIELKDIKVGPMVSFEGEKQSDRKKKRAVRKCLLCGHTASSSSHMKDHMVTHTGELRYACPTCNIRFKWRYQRKAHILKCSPTKTSRYQRKAHILKCSPTKTSDRTCKYCGKEFRYRSKLLEHLPVHTDEKNYPCKSCGLKFKWRSVRESHMTRCSYSKRTKNYTDQSLLKKAGKILPNTSDKNYSDNRNKHGNSTSAGQKLQKRHIIILSGIRPFKCALCQARFTRKNNLMKHQRISCPNLKVKANRDHPISFH